MRPSIALVAAGLVSAAAALVSAPVFAAPAPLTNAAIRVELDTADGSLVVTDLRTQLQWRQLWLEKDVAFQQKLIADNPAAREWTLECGMAGTRADGKPSAAPARLRLRIDAERPDIDIVLTSLAPEGWRNMRYPYAFVRDGDRMSNLFPHCEGMLVPVRKADPDWLALPDGSLYGGVHAYCMCLGLLDEATGQGLLTILPDIEDTDLRWRDVPIGDQKVVAPQFVIPANLGTFERPWRMTLSFHDQGGYVAMAKRYRRFFAAAGYRKTLVEKAAENPAVNDLAGTTVFWACGSRPQHARETADLIRSYGVDRCLLAMCNIPSRKPGDPAYQQEMTEAIKHIRSLGYHVYRYDQYRDAFDPDPAAKASHQLNAEAWPDKLVMGSNGQRLAAFGPGSGVICPKFFMPLAKATFAREFSEHAYSAWFLDCIGSCGFSEGECHDPRHRTDRYECRREREALFVELKTHGKLAATECGIDYLIPHIHWAEGATTLVRWRGAIHPQQVVEAGDINATPKKNQDQVLHELAKLPPTAKADLTVSISPRFRIPFYSLCHHDEVVQTWRWEDGMDYPPVYWQWKNLWTVLSASAPMYRIYGGKVKEYAEEIRRTQKYVNEWVRQVAFDEMTNHRFLTPDRRVQESEFSSGKGVVVNFGDEPHTLPGGQVVKPRDYVMFTVSDGRRTYAPPPCPNVFAE